MAGTSSRFFLLKNGMVLVVDIHNCLATRLDTSALLTFKIGYVILSGIGLMSQDKDP